MEPGQTHYTWMSPNIDEYCDKCMRALNALDLTLKRCADLVDCRIEGVFNEMLKTKLCQFNGEEPMTIADFLSTTEELCRLGSQALQVKSKNIEEAVDELIGLVYPEYNMPLEGQDEEIMTREAEPMTERNEEGKEIG